MFTATGITTEDAADNLLYDMGELVRRCGDGGESDIMDYVEVICTLPAKPEIETKPKYVAINSVMSLMELADNDDNPDNGLDCFILLEGGGKSSKYITYDATTKFFHVWNLIDNNEQVLTFDEVYNSDNNNIGTAIKNGNFYYELSTNNK